MNWIESLLSQTEITHATVVVRLLVSLLLSGIIGWERQRNNQAAGLRTHILICLGATLLMMVSIYIPQTFFNFKNGDPGRIAAQVVSGIGFLGAGAIFRLGASVKGLTTAATIWVSAALGLAVGVGMYQGAVYVTFLVLFVLEVLEMVEKKFFAKHSLRVLRLHFQTTEVDSKEVVRILRKHGIKTQSVSIDQLLGSSETKLKLLIQLPKESDIKLFYKELNHLPMLDQISLGQNF
jgi:putative Mg2+ transporter-C (MgtC) family protein